MALTKRTYVDGETIITAQNLNDIQDEVIAHESNKVPVTRTVNGKALSSNITLSASDVSAVPTTRTVNSKALSSNITLTAANVGAAPTSHASTATTYGKGTSSNYGHVKISDSLTDTTTAATGGVVPSMKAVSDLNGAISDEATARENADTAIQNKLNVIGTILEAPASPVTVASGAVVEITSITLPIGNWIILGSFIYTVSFSQAANGYIMIGSDVILTTRGTGINGGTFAPLVASIANANNTTVTMKTYQESGSEKTASPYYFRAIRIS